MAFNINDFLNDESKRDRKNNWKPIKISVYKLRPSSEKENFYHLSDKEIEETARTIELVGIQQYPVVRPIEGTDEYEVLVGHKRRMAILKLMEEGKTEYEMIPCKVETGEDNIRNELILIFTNSTQRERNDYEKMQEVKRVRELLSSYGKKITGKKQDVIASILNINKTKVGTLENIDKNLTEPFKNEFEKGNISTNTANEIAGLKEEKQQLLYEQYTEKGGITAKEVKEVKSVQEEEMIEGQMNIEQYPEYLPDGYVVKEDEKVELIEVEENLVDDIGQQKTDEESEKNDVSDAEYRRVLEHVWLETKSKYKRVLQEKDVPEALVIKYRILKEAMELYRKEYQERMRK